MIIITKEDNYFNGFRFVLSPYDKNHSKFDVIQVYDKITATDGKRLHRAKIEHNIEYGYYKVLKNTTKEIQLKRYEGEVADEWEEISSVFETCEEYKRYIRVDAVIESNFYFIVAATLVGYRLAFNIDYMKPLLKIKKMWEMYFDTNDEKFYRPIYFHCVGLEVIIMPMNIFWEQLGEFDK